MAAQTNTASLEKVLDYFRKRTEERVEAAIKEISGDTDVKEYMKQVDEDEDESPEFFLKTLDQKEDSKVAASCCRIHHSRHNSLLVGRLATTETSWDRG